MFSKWQSFTSAASVFLGCLSLAIPGLAAAPKFTVLYGFNEQVNSAAGQAPSGLAIGGGGVLYGTAGAGGAYNNGPEGCEFGCGAVFSLAPPSTQGGPWTETVLWNFGGAPGDGVIPVGGVVVGSGGVLYGTATGGGYPLCGCGVVFSLTPPESRGGAWTESILLAFGSVDGSGQRPETGLALGGDGVLYGTTSEGGRYGTGTVFSLAPPATQGDPWTETVLWSLGGTGDGSTPSAAVVIGSGGVLYGTTSAGGANNYGTVFSLSPPSAQSGPWSEAVLMTFDAASGRPSAGGDRPRRRAVRDDLRRQPQRRGHSILP